MSRPRRLNTERCFLSVTGPYPNSNARKPLQNTLSVLPLGKGGQFCVWCNRSANSSNVIIPPNENSIWWADISKLSMAQADMSVVRNCSDNSSEICRTRSLVKPMRLPVSSSVLGSPSTAPRRSARILFFIASVMLAELQSRENSSEKDPESLSSVETSWRALT